MSDRELDRSDGGDAWRESALRSQRVDGLVRMAGNDLQALRQREAPYRTIVDRAPIGIVLADETGLILVANPAFEVMVGYNTTELQTLRFADLTHPDDVAMSRQAVQRLVVGHRSGYALDKRYLRKDGGVVWARVSLSVLIDADGQLQGLIAMQEDITERRAIEQALRTSEEQRRQMFELNSVVQLLIEPDTGAIVDANLAACAFYGASHDGLCATTIHALNVLSADIVAAETARAQREGRPYTLFRHRLWSHEERDVELHSSLIEVDGRPLLFAIVHDVTDRIRVEAELMHRALHDALTELPNRILFQDRLEQALLRTQRDGLSVALLVLDLDRFKEINDTFGHAVGDLLLQQVGLRLGEIVRQSDSLVRLVPATVARLGGDEFALILHHVDEPGAITVAERLIDAVRDVILVAEQRLTVGPAWASPSPPNMDGMRRVCCSAPMSPCTWRSGNEAAMRSTMRSKMSTARSDTRWSVTCRRRSNSGVCT